MTLNWTPENISNFIISIIFLLEIFFLFRNYTPPHLKVITYFRAFWIAGFFFFIFEGFASLLMEPLFSRLSGITTIFIAIFLVIAINNALNESYAVSILFPLVGLGTLSIYLAIQPGAVAPSFIGGFLTYSWIGLFKVLSYGFLFFLIFSFLIWVARIRKNAPFEINRESNMLLLSSTLICVFSCLFNIIYFWIPIFIVFSNCTVIFGLTAMILILKKEPKLLFVLPFTPYRIMVLNRKGDVLYQYLWSQLGVSEPQITIYLSLVQFIPDKTSPLKGVLEIHLQESVIIFYESEAIRVGLFVSKASKLLRELIAQFAWEFEIKFKTTLESNSIHAADFEPARELITKYFSIFPSRIIDEKKKPLFLSKKVFKMSPALEAKLKAIVKDEKELDLIRCEIQRSLEKQLPNEFLALYEELKDELAEEKEENQKKKEINEELEHPN